MKFIKYEHPYNKLENIADELLLKCNDPLLDKRTEKFYTDLYTVAKTSIKDFKKIDKSVEYKRLLEEICNTLGRWSKEFELLKNTKKTIN